MTGQDFFFRVRGTSFHIYFPLLTFFLCFIVLFQSRCSHARVFGKTLVHEFPISYSHTEWNLLSSGTNTLLWWRACFCGDVPAFVVTCLLLWWRACFCGDVPAFVVTWLLLWWRDCFCGDVTAFVVTCLLLWWRACYQKLNYKQTNKRRFCTIDIYDTLLSDPNHKVKEWIRSLGFSFVLFGYSAVSLGFRLVLLGFCAVSLGFSAVH